MIPFLGKEKKKKKKINSAFASHQSLIQKIIEKKDLLHSTLYSLFVLSCLFFFFFFFQNADGIPSRGILTSFLADEYYKTIKKNLIRLKAMFP